MNLNVYSVGAASVTATVQPTTDADKLNSGDDFWAAGSICIWSQINDSFCHLHEPVNLLFTRASKSFMPTIPVQFHMCYLDCTINLPTILLFYFRPLKFTFTSQVFNKAFEVVIIISCLLLSDNTELFVILCPDWALFTLVTSFMLSSWMVSPIAAKT